MADIAAQTLQRMILDRSAEGAQRCLVASGVDMLTKEEVSLVWMKPWGLGKAAFLLLRYWVLKELVYVWYWEAVYLAMHEEVSAKAPHCWASAKPSMNAFKTAFAFSLWGNVIGFVRGYIEIGDSNLTIPKELTVLRRNRNLAPMYLWPSRREEEVQNYPGYHIYDIASVLVRTIGYAYNKHQGDGSKAAFSASSPIIGSWLEVLVQRLQLYEILCRSDLSGSTGLMLTIAVTLYTRYRPVMELETAYRFPTLAAVIRRDGGYFFVGLIAVNLTLCATHPPLRWINAKYAGSVTAFSSVVTPILISNLVINLRQEYASETEILSVSTGLVFARS
ncbi:hypothetical protein NMY22_g15112 [Coprinellus aureogranulatus]|nr:hypothetical protein NMY22_g15112 [Coprinellus aureogranulatus]